MFLASGVEKIIMFSNTSTKFSKKMGFPILLAQIVILGVILLEIFAPAAILGYTFTGSNTLVPFFQLSVLGLIGFTALATMLYHNPLQNKNNYYTFMSHTAIIGGLLALYVCC